MSGCKATGAREPRAEARQRDSAQGVGLFRPGGARPPTEVMVAFIDEHRGAYGVEPICSAAADRPVDVLRAAGSRRPIRRGARRGPRRDAELCAADPACLARELLRLRGAKDLASAEPRGHPRGALHGRAADAPAGSARGGARRALQDDDGTEPGRAAARRPGAAAILGRRGPTSSGWPTSPTWRPGEGLCTSRSSSTSSHA